MSKSALTLRHLRAGYGPHVVVEDVSIEIEAGEWYALMGPNGCGKSTLIGCIVGRLQPAAGDIEIDGHSLKQDAFQAKRSLGYGCPPETLPALLTARQCLEIHAAAKRVSAIDARIMALADELKFLPYLNAFVDTLSLGTRQKLAVLLALVGDPQLIVLDEAFNGLDPGSALILKQHLHARLHDGAALLLATHALDLVEHHADRAALLIDGRLRREWTQTEIRAMRADGQGFEAAFAATVETRGQARGCKKASA